MDVGAPAHHHLVFKAHPLEDGRVPVRRALKRLARSHGIGNQIKAMDGHLPHLDEDEIRAKCAERAPDIWSRIN